MNFLRVEMEENSNAAHAFPHHQTPISHTPHRQTLCNLTLTGEEKTVKIINLVQTG